MDGHGDGSDGRKKPPELEIEESTPRGLSVTADRPYRILFVADFSGGEGGEVCGDLRAGMVELTSGGVDAAMAAATPTIQLALPERLAGKTAPPVPMQFAGLRDFTPQRVAERLPATQQLSVVRRSLVDRLFGRLSAEKLAAAVAATSSSAATNWIGEFLARRAAPGAPAAKANSAAVDALLGQLDLGESDAAESSGAGAPAAGRSPAAEAVAAAAGGPAVPAEEAARIRQTISEIDRRMNDWLNAAMHAPSFKGAEAAWRSAAFIAGHADHRRGLRVSILHARRGELVDRLVSGMIDPVFDAGAPSPELIAVEGPFGAGTADVEVLDGLAQHAASLPAVVLAEAGPAFFGVQNAWQVPTLPPLNALLDQWQYAKWRTLRGQPYAASLGLVFGRCLLRAAYEREETREQEFRFHEEVLSERDGLWASGTAAVAAAVARSVSDTAWPTAIAGVIQGRLGGFATTLGGKDGKKRYGPADTQIPPARLSEFAGAGLNVVSTLPDDDAVYVWNGLAALYAGKVSEDALLEITLAYRLFAVRLSNLLYSLKPHLTGLPPDRVAADARAHVLDWFGAADGPAAEGVLVQARPAADHAGTVELAVTVTPPPTLLPGGVPVVLGYRIP